MEPLVERGAQPQLPSTAQRLARLARPFTTPHLPGDYLALLDPRWSLEEAAATVERRIEEAPGATTLVLRPTFSWPGHRPGQYVRLGVEIDGIRHWRAYTLTSDPGHPEGLVSVTVQRVDDGLVSPYLTDAERCAPGSRVWLGDIEGDIDLPTDGSTPLLLITAGCGITPAWALLRELDRRDALHDVTHLHSARDAEHFIFGRQLRELATRAPGYRLHEQRTHEHGRLHRQDLDRLVPDWRDRRAALVGPSTMAEDFERHWLEHGDPGRLHVERFRPSIGTGGGLGEGGSLTLSVSRVHVDVEPGESILVAGERAGAQMPHGCRMGICHSCIGRLRAGQVQDLRTGEIHGEVGQPVRTCVNGPCGDTEIEL